nr:uncharacterized protein LOC129447702 [Misgurnus anguillicaudatus]
MGLANSLFIQLGCIKEQGQREIQRPSDSTQRDFRCDAHRRKTLKKCHQIEQKRVSLDPVLEYSASETKTEFEKKTESSRWRKSERERQKKKRMTDDTEGMKRKSALKPLVVNAAPQNSASAPERSKPPRKRVKDSEQHMNALGQKEKSFPSSASKPRVMIHVAPVYSTTSPEMRRSRRKLNIRAKEQHINKEEPSEEMKMQSLNKTNHEGSSELPVGSASFSPNPQDTQKTKLKKAAKDSEQHVLLSGEKKLKTFIKRKQTVAPRTSAPAHEEVKCFYSSVSELLVLDVAYFASAPEESEQQRETLQQTGQIKRQTHIQTNHEESNPLPVGSALLNSDVEYTEVITLSTTSSQSDLTPQLTDILMDIEYEDSGCVEDDDVQFISQSELKDNGCRRRPKAGTKSYPTFCWMEKTVEMLETESQSETDEVQLEAPKLQEAPCEKASIETNNNEKHVFQKTRDEIDENIMKMFQVRSNGTGGAAQPQVKGQEKTNAVNKTKGLFVLHTWAEQQARKKEEKKRRKEKERRDRQLLLEKYTNSPAMKHLLINKHNRFNETS